MFMLNSASAHYNSYCIYVIFCCPCNLFESVTLCTYVSKIAKPTAVFSCLQFLRILVKIVQLFLIVVPVVTPSKITNRIPKYLIFTDLWKRLLTWFFAHLWILQVLKNDFRRTKKNWSEQGGICRTNWMKCRSTDLMAEDLKCLQEVDEFNANTRKELCNGHEN